WWPSTSSPTPRGSATGSCCCRGERWWRPAPSTSCARARPHRRSRRPLPLPSRTSSLLSPALLRKDARELFVSRAFGLHLVLAGPLVGQAFITAVRSYAEASGAGGTAALAEGLHPLDGILVPTLGAYDLIATLVFPFVAVRLVSAEKESGALKLLLQGPARLPAQLVSKAAALLLAW